MAKEYVRPITPSHWFERPTWRRFMLRELTAVFVAGYAIFLVVLVGRAADRESFLAFVQGLRSPLSILLHLVALAMGIFHAVTWLQASPQAFVLWRGEERVSPGLIVGWQYAVWVILSLVVGGLALVLGGS